MSKVAVFNQCPGSEVRAESPLAHLASIKGGSSLVVTEHAFLGHLILRGQADNESLKAAVQSVIGVELPLQPLTLALNETTGASVQWLSPDEWLLILPAGQEYDVEQNLRQQVSGHFSIVNVGGGQTLLRLTGSKVFDLLSKSCVYDVHERNFPVGKGVSTTFAKATAIIRRPNEQEWELVIRRSFSDYCYRWIADAGREFDLTFTV